MIKQTILGISLFVLASTASAACSKATAAGSWQSFISENGWGWSTCTIKINNSGKAVGGSCRDNTGANAPISGGQITTKSSCEMTGYLIVGNTRNNLPAARLSLDRNTISGVVEVYGDTTTFTAQRF